MKCVFSRPVGTLSCRNSDPEFVLFTFRVDVSTISEKRFGFIQFEILKNNILQLHVTLLLIQEVEFLATGLDLNVVWVS